MPSSKRLIKTWVKILRKILQSVSMAVTVGATEGIAADVVDSVGVLPVTIHMDILGVTILMHAHQEHFIGELFDFFMRKL